MNVEGPLNLQQYLRERKEIVDEALDRYLPGENQFPEAIFQAVRYSTFAGGKRIRPILCMAAAEAVGGTIDAVLPYACAIELIHTYSLIHDDLPAMDNDDFRRGKPTSHKVFGEAIAVLAGDALLTEAFHLMTQPASGETRTADADVRLALIHDIAAAAGCFGMIGGQVVDIQSQGKQIDPDILHYIHTHKTGAMILVSLRAGAILGGADAVSRQCLSEYGRNIGLAFQIADDILDVEGSRELLGKDTGMDETLKKATYPATLGMAQAKEQGHRLVDAALGAISPLDGRAEPLRELARYIMSRSM